MVRYKWNMYFMEKKIMGHIKEMNIVFRCSIIVILNPNKHTLSIGSTDGLILLIFYLKN
jgi:hypothetical protein